MNGWIGGATAAVAMALAIPTGLTAQGHPMGQDHPMGQMSTPMHGMMQSTDMPMMQMMHSTAMTPAPRMLLAQREPLKLSDQQVDRLEKLQEQLDTAVAKHHEEMGPLHEQLAGLRTSEEVDVERYEDLLRQAADRHVALHVERARIGEAALQLLDEEQRSNVRYGMRMQRMKQPEAGMMSGGRMMMQNMHRHMQQMGQMHEGCPSRPESDGK